MASNEVMAGDIIPFASEMRKLINSKEFSDIKFLIGPNRKVVYAHRNILSARCEVFRAMFADHSQKGSSDTEVPFVLSDITPDVFLSVLEFLYTNCVTLTSKNTIDVLGSAIEYGLDELRKICCQYLIENLDINSSAETMQAAVTYGQDELKSSTMEYVEENTGNIFKTKSFHEMSEYALAEVLKSDNLNIDEADLINAIREWATVNSVVMGKPIPEVSQCVVQHIRLPLLSTEEMTAIENESKKDKLLPMANISLAWKFHALKKGEKGNPLTRKRKGTKARDCHTWLDK